MLETNRPAMKDDRMNVIKYGKYDSPTVGELQQYCCRPCNYEFTPFP